MSNPDLIVGSRVRFVARFRDNGKLADPDQPYATVTTNRATKMLTLQNGGIKHDADGVFSVVVTLDSSPFIEVKFAAAAGPGEPFAEQVFRVVQPAAARQTLAAPELELPAVVEPGIGVDARRQQMLNALRERGVRVDEKDSDAYVEGAYAQLERKRQANMAEKLREEWKKPLRR